MKPDTVLSDRAVLSCTLPPARAKSDADALRAIVKLLLQALRATPGGVTTFGRMALERPDIMALLLELQE